MVIVMWDDDLGLMFYGGFIMGEINSFDPRLECAGQLYINSRADKANYGIYLKKFKDIRNSPFVLNSKNLKEGVAILLQACLDSFPASMNEKASDELYDRSSLADISTLIKKEVSNFKKVAKDHIGTHTGKIPNPSVKGQGGLFYDKTVFERASKLSYVSSASIKAGQRLGASGNAAQNRAQRFLAATFLVDGEPVSVYEDIGHKGGIFQQLLVLGFPQHDLEAISSTIAARLSSENTEAPGQYSKGLIWPTPNGDVVITPVHPYAMAMEMHLRYKSRDKAGASIPNTWINIGADKPQNGGLVNNDLGGTHCLLKSIPPKRMSRLGGVAFKAGATNSVPFAAVGRSHPVMKALIAAITDARLNDDLKRRQQDAIARLVRISLQPWIEFASLVKSGDKAALRSLDKIHSGQRKLFEGNLKDISTSEYADMSEAVATHVMGLKHGMSGDSYRAQVKSAVAVIFKKNF